MKTRPLYVMLGALALLPSALTQAEPARFSASAQGICAQAWGLQPAVLRSDCGGAFVRVDRDREERWERLRRHERGQSMDPIYDGHKWRDRARDEERWEREHRRRYWSGHRDNRRYYYDDDDDRDYRRWRDSRYRDDRDDDDDDDDQWRDVAAAAAAIGGVMVLSSIMDQNSAPPPPAYYDQPSSAVPGWAVGQFRGYNNATGQQVELNIQPNGQVVGYAGGVPVQGTWNNGLLNMAGYRFEVIPQGDGFRTRPLGDASRDVYYRRVY